MEKETQNILVVDDEENNIIAVRRPLKKEGFRVLSASSGEECLKILKEEEVDLLLLDWMMPGLSGLEVCRKMKADENLRYIPIILVSARADMEDLRLGLEAGANDYVKKPVEMVELLSRVKSGIRTRSLQLELSKKNERLAELNKMKDEFLSIASHDLRSPLAAIHSFTELIQMADDTKVAPQYKDMVGRIQRLGKNLLDLIDDLLDLSKMEAGRVELEPYCSNIFPYVEEAVHNFSVLAKEKDIRIDLEVNKDMPMVMIDPKKIIQVMNNLIGNAIKFTGMGGKISITASLANEKEVEFRVNDTGRGIPEKDIPHLFTQFSTASKKGTKGEKGTGLGLSICKKLVELHGGTIGVASEPDKGSSFFFRLPICKLKET